MGIALCYLDLLQLLMCSSLMILSSLLMSLDEVQLNLANSFSPACHGKLWLVDFQCLFVYERWPEKFKFNTFICPLSGAIDFTA